MFYFGPMTYSPKIKIQDFMALELQQGYAVLYVDYGTGTAKLDQRQIKLTDGKSHKIDVYWTKNVNAVSFVSWDLAKMQLIVVSFTFRSFYRQSR